MLEYKRCDIITAVPRRNLGEVIKKPIKYFFSKELLERFLTILESRKSKRKTVILDNHKLILRD